MLWLAVLIYLLGCISIARHRIGHTAALNATIETIGWPLCAVYYIFLALCLAGLLAWTDAEARISI